MRNYGRIRLATLLINLVGAFIIFFYFAYIDLETFYENKAFWRGTSEDWTTFAVIMVALSVGGMLLTWRYGKTLKHWEGVIRQGTPIEKIPLAIQKLAATYPIRVAVIVFMMWLLAGGFFAQGGLTIASVGAGTFWRTLIGIAGVGGLICSTLTFLVVDTLWGQSMPTFFPDSDPGELGIWRVTVGQRMLGTLLLTGVVPLIVLAGAARTSIFGLMAFELDPYETLDNLQRTILYVVGVSMVSNVVLGLLATRSLLHPLQRLIKGMECVGGCDFSSRLSVQSTDELGYLAYRFNQMVTELQESQQMRDLFGRYVSREVADQVLRKGAALGGEQVSATVLFADIRDFTGLSERLPAEQVVDILNRYYTRMVDVIIEHGGWVNKFGGDSLLAVFGVPIRQPDHALRAVRAAWQMNRALAGFNAEQAALGLPPLTIGVGISSGDMVAGNIGGTERLEYTVIGDPVNLAARLQTLTKEMGQPILLSGFTQSQIDHTNVDLEFEPCEKVTVRGKSQATQVYALRGLALNSAEHVQPA